MLFDKKTEETEEYPESSEYAIGTGFFFDWDTDTHDIVNGTPAEVTGEDAVKAWLRQCIHTRRGVYAAYPADYGTTLLDNIGKKFPRGFEMSELRRELLESAKYCPAIQSISGMVYDRGVITCTVTLQDGYEMKEVIHIGPT